MSLRGERASTSLFVTVALLLAGALASGLVLADESGPECGIPAAPCPLGQGTQEGTLQPVVNERDYYVFTPPAGATGIHVDASSDARVEVVLRDPEGTVRAAGITIFQDIQLNAVGQPDGEWSLEIGYYFASPPLLGNSYTIDLGYIEYDHFERHQSDGGEAPTVSFGMSADLDTQFDVIFHLGTADHPGQGSQAFFSAVAYRTQSGVGSGRSAGLGCCGSFDDLVKTWGTLPEDVHIEAPGLGLPGSSVALFNHHHHDVGGPVEIDVGVSTSRGIEDVDVWIAWNGTAPDVTPKHGDAFYHRVADLEGGEGAYAAGFGHVQDQWIEEDLPSLDTHLSVILGNGYTPYPAVSPTQATVTLPDGEEDDISGNSEAYFPWPGYHEPQEGTWRYDLHQTQGKEGDAIRFAGAVFPMPITPLDPNP